MRKILCFTLICFILVGCQTIDKNTQQVRQDLKVAKAEIDQHVATAFSTVGLPNLAKWTEDQVRWTIGTTASETEKWTYYIVDKAKSMAKETSVEISILDYRDANISVNTPFGFVSVRNAVSGKHRYLCIIPGTTTIIEAGLKNPIKGMKKEIDAYVASTFANFGFPQLAERFDPINVTGTIGATIGEVNAWTNNIIETVNKNAGASVVLSVENYHSAAMEIGAPFSFISMRHKTTGEIRYFAIAPGFSALVETKLKN